MKTKWLPSPWIKGQDLINVIVETPKGSRNKYAYQEDSGLLSLKKVLPCGMVFPFDFGCIPGTKGDDGDPLDILVLMEDGVCPLCLVQARLIGVIEAVQTEKGKKTRNDRLIAITEGDNQSSEISSIKKLKSQTIKEIERFFVSYNELAGKKFQILRYRGVKAALKMVKRGEKKYKAT